MAPSSLVSRIHRKLFPPKPVRPVSVRCESSFVGTTYGGCPVYLPALNTDSVVYSVGVGEDTSFDEALIETVGCRVYAFDPTPRAEAWIDQRRASGALDDRLVFSPWALADTDKTATFAMPNNTEHVSGSLVNHGSVGETSIEVQCRSLASIARELGHDRVDMLKIDIEGSEYEVMPDVLASGVPVGQILVEVHERFFDDGRRRTEVMLDQLEKAGYGIFATATSARHYSLIHSSVLGRA